MAYGSAIIAVFGIGWHIRGLSDESALKSALDRQETALNAQCDSDKKTTKEANDAIQQNMSTIASKLNADKRLHPSVCITPSSRLAKYPAGGAGEHAGQGGTVAGTSDDFRDYFAECEQYRSEVILLNDFGINERK